METKASYVAVGAFVVALATGALVFAIWLGGLQFDRQVDRYLIRFAGSVTGLNQGSGVRFQGVPVGQVISIGLDHENPALVKVVIEVLATTPVRADSVATLQMQGITGQLYVQISPGAPDAPLPMSAPGEELPELVGEPSTIEQLTSSLPDTLENINEVLARTQALLSEENTQAVSESVANVARITGSFDSVAENINDLVNTLRVDTAEIATTVDTIGRRADGLITNFDGLVEEVRVDAARLSDLSAQLLASADAEIIQIGQAVSAAVAELRQVASEFGDAATAARTLFSEIRPGLTDFSESGLYEFTLLVNELRFLAENLSQLTVRIGQDPVQFLFGGSRSGGVPVER